jgi:hypothetical protein
MPNMADRISTRRNTSGAQLTPTQTEEDPLATQVSNPVQLKQEDLGDFRKLIQVCMANLTVIRDHLTCCKDGLGKRQNYLVAADLIQKGLQQVLDIGSSASNAQSINTEEIKRIVEEAIETKMSAITAASPPAQLGRRHFRSQLQNSAAKTLNSTKTQNCNHTSRKLSWSKYRRGH